MVRIALPNKGRIYEPIMDLFERAGLHVVDHSERSLFAKTVDEDISLLFAGRGTSRSTWRTGPLTWG